MRAHRFAPVTSETWADFEALFESPGAPKYCWCMVWRHMAERASATNADRKRAIKTFVRAGTPVGLLAYSDSRPIAWCSVAPRSSLRKLSPMQDDVADGTVWSIVCFFIRKEHRRKGVGSALLDAAIAHAFAAGADVVEAYPVDPESPSYRFMGFRAMFSARGFREIGMAGARRYVMRLGR